MCTQWLQNDALAKTKTTEKLDIDQPALAILQRLVVVLGLNAGNVF